jgi:hypothetical protein
MDGHLRNLIDDSDGGNPDSSVNPQSPETLDSLIGGDSTPAPVADSAHVPDAVAAAFNLRQNLQDRFGLEADQFDTDDDAFSAYGEALTEASEILNDPGYQAYQTQQEQFQAFLKSQESPAEPAATKPPTAVPVLATSSTKVSEDAQIMAQQGLITRGDDGVWAAKNPALKAFADEYNKHDMAIRANVMKFSQDPDGFTQKIIERYLADKQPVADAEPEYVTAMKAQLKAVTDQLAAQSEQKANNTLDDWRNTTPLRDAAGSLTPYAKTYMKWETKVREEHPSLGRMQIHDKVLAYLDIAGVSAEALTTETPVTSKPSTPMVDKVRRRAAATNGNGTNRLKEYAAENPHFDPKVLTGKAGLPSLSALIAAGERELTE